MYHSLFSFTHVFSFSWHKKQLTALSAVIMLCFLAATTAYAETDKQLVVFGHNPYEQGNFPALVGVLDNTYSDENGNRIGTGPSIADVVSQTLFQNGVIANVSQPALFSGQGTNYAVTTAATRVKDDALSSLIGLPTQVATYLSQASAESVSDNLYLFAPGQNDVLDAVGTGSSPLLSCDRFRARQYYQVYRKTQYLNGDYTGRFEGSEYERVAELMYAAISSSTALLDQLQAAGAKDILVANVSSPALFPILKQIAAGFSCDADLLADKANLLTQQFNTAIKRYVKRSNNQDMVVYNVQRDIKQLRKNASAYGFSDTQNSCYLVDASQPQIFANPAVQCDDSNENQFLYYAALTLSAPADRFIGQKMAADLLLMAK